MSKTGIAGMVQSAAWMSHQMDLEVVAFGRAGDAPKDSCLLQMTGRFLAYDVFLDGGWIFLSAQLMDRSDPPESLASFGDGRGWLETGLLDRSLS